MMNLPDPIAIAIRTLADWLDDRLTIAAIGLATGYFGMGDAQWGAISNWIVGTATVILVLIPDPRKRVKNELPPIEPQGWAGCSGYPRDGADPVRAANGLRQPVPSNRDPDADTQPNRWDSGGFGDK